MAEHERLKWDRRYGATDELRMGRAPKAWLPELAGHLPVEGTALDLACGEGQAAVWLAARGLVTTGVDISGVGLAKAQRLAQAEGVEVEWIRADLDTWDPEGRLWDVVTCSHYLSRPLVGRLAGWVAPGGVVLLEMLVAHPDVEAHVSARYLAAPGEVRGWLDGFEELAYAELVGEGRAVARRVVRRPYSVT